MAYTHNYIPYNHPYVNTLKSCINLSIPLIHQLKSFSDFSIHYTKISSHGLINEHEQFNLNHSPKHILSQKYFENTIHRSLFMCQYSRATIYITIYVNSKPLGLLFMANHPTSVPLCEPEIHSHFRPHTHQHTIYFINYETNTSNSPYTVTNCPNGLQKFSKNSNNSVPSFETDQTTVQGLKPTETLQNT